MTKVEKIVNLLNTTPRPSDSEIARRVRTTRDYVVRIRRRMAHISDHAEETPETANSEVTQVIQDRQHTHGDFGTTAWLAQGFKRHMNGYLETHCGFLASDKQEALEMIFTKIARILSGDPDNIDSWTDIAGYAKLVADRLSGAAK